MQFSYGKRAIFCKDKEIKALRGDVHRYVAQARPQIDDVIAENGRFRMKTSYGAEGKQGEVVLKNANKHQFIAQHKQKYKY